MNMLFILTQLILILSSSNFRAAESRCTKGCDLALASYYVWDGNNLTLISQLTNKPIPEILSYNPQIPNQDSVQQGTRMNIPFSCDCLRDGQFLGHDFNYIARSQDTYDTIAEVYYSNLTTTDWLQAQNIYPATNIPDTGVTLNITVNCSCGNADINKTYGMFVTYPLRDGETLNSIATANNLSADLIAAYNPGVDFSAGSGLIFFPGRDKDGTFPPLITSKGGLKGGAIAGISIGLILGLLLLSGCLYFVYYRRKKAKKSSLLPERSEDTSNQPFHDGRGNIFNTPDTSVTPETSINRSVEFRYEELAMATDDFSIANKIGQGGFGAVYYAELRGEKAAIKKMDMQATREFRAELKVLTNVHHVNLVRLIGYCTEGSLFLVYEFIENGNLSEHLRGSGKNPLAWASRVQIALDSARGLEYIHEHTVPVYIHRDIKSANILIDKNFHGKVADFGLTKLTIVGGNNSEATRLVGTFGYMPPEYARYGEVSPKVDVYAFGVVLYELISAKEAIVKPNGSTNTESKGLVGLFEEALSQSDSKESLRGLVDPTLVDNCPIDSVFKMAQLAKACTNENPQLRPSMRSVVVALMTLSSTTEDWDVASFYGNQGLVDLMSAR